MPPFAIESQTIRRLAFGCTPRDLALRILREINYQARPVPFRFWFQ